MIEKSASSPASTEDPLIGTLLEDRYRILSVVGRGGMGVVYRAKQEYMDRIVAVKMLQPQLVKDSITVKRFEQEAKSASRLMHPNIITLHDYGFVGEVPYLVMDFVQGTSLSELIKSGGSLGVMRSINIFAQVCDALEHAHRNGIVHRDLKPGNIMLLNTDQQDDFVKVVDFGVAKILELGDEDSQRLTSTGEIFGSPVYMSPEQCEGRHLDGRADLYSMGVVMFETLTGKLPLAGKNVIETITKHLNEIPPSFNQVRPDLYFPDRLEAAVMRALEKHPDDRQQSMLELKNELLAASPRRRASSMSMTSLTAVSTTSQDNAVVVQEQPRRSYKVPIIIGILMAFVVVAAVAFTLVSSLLRGVHPMNAAHDNNDGQHQTQSAPDVDSPTDTPTPPKIPVVHESPPPVPPPQQNQTAAPKPPHQQAVIAHPRPKAKPPRVQQTYQQQTYQQQTYQQPPRHSGGSASSIIRDGFGGGGGGGGSPVWQPRPAGSVNYENEGFGH